MIDVCSIPVQKGGHRSAEEGMCVMEMTSYLAHEPFSDRPKCASPVIAGLLRRVNDSLSDNLRQQLKPYAFRVIGSAGSIENDRTRAYMAADWSIRTVLPWLYRRLNREDLALRCEAIPQLVDRQTSQNAAATVREIRAAAAYADADADAAYAAAAAAYAYADAAYADAAYAAAAAYAAYAAAAAAYAYAAYADADADADAAYAAADAAYAAAYAYAAAPSYSSRYQEAREKAWSELLPSFFKLLDSLLTVGK